MKCKVPKCSNKARFRFPSNLELRKKWVELIKLPADTEIKTRHGLCKDHFTDKDFTRTEKDIPWIDIRYRLMNQAVPSIFSWNIMRESIDIKEESINIPIISEQFPISHGLASNITVASSTPNLTRTDLNAENKFPKEVMDYLISSDDQKINLDIDLNETWESHNDPHENLHENVINNHSNKSLQLIQKKLTICLERIDSSLTSFTRGRLVWARFKMFWPAVIIKPSDIGKEECDVNEIWVCWIGRFQVSKLKKTLITDFKVNLEENLTTLFSFAATKENQLIFRKLTELLKELFNVMEEVDCICTFKKTFIPLLKRGKFTIIYPYPPAMVEALAATEQCFETKSR